LCFLPPACASSVAWLVHVTLHALHFQGAAFDKNSSPCASPAAAPSAPPAVAAAAAAAPWAALPPGLVAARAYFSCSVTQVLCFCDGWRLLHMLRLLYYLFLYFGLLWGRAATGEQLRVFGGGSCRSIERAHAPADCGGALRGARRRRGGSARNDMQAARWRRGGVGAKGRLQARPAAARVARRGTHLDAVAVKRCAAVNAGEPVAGALPKVVHELGLRRGAEGGGREGEARGARRDAGAGGRRPAGSGGGGRRVRTFLMLSPHSSQWNHTMVSLSARARRPF
jgi:hypothetical protein